MEIISQNEVELTAEEAHAHRRFDAMLDKGYSVRRAAHRTEEMYPGLDPAFYRWIGGQERGLSPWHRETWDFITDTLRETLAESGFEIHVNGPAGTLTVIERASNKALTIAPASNTQYGVQVGAAAL